MRSASQRQDAKDAKIAKEQPVGYARRSSSSPKPHSATREPDNLLDALARQVIGAAIEVHRALGPGYVESVYHKALAVELRLQGVPHEIEVPFPLRYKGQLVGEGWADIVVAERLIIELKAVEALGSIHSAQLLSYMRAGGYSLGLLINFNVRVLKEGVKRLVHTPRE